MIAPPFRLLLFLLCVAGVAVFEGVEIALLASDRFLVRAAASKGRPEGTDLSLDLLRRRDRILVTLLVVNTFFATAAAAIATSLVEGWMGPRPAAAVITTVAVTAIVLVFGQVLPKSFARVRAEAILAALARPLFALDLLLLPVTAIAGGLVNRVLRLLGVKRSHLVTREELEILVQDVQQETGPLRQEKRMLQSILGFGHTTAREVMIPMPAVVSLDRTSSVDMLRAVIRRRGYTRIPVFDRRVDRVIGVLQVFDVLLDPEKGETIEDWMRPITLVPETKRINRLMVEMQRRGESMVVVVNEFGSCTGIVTMEDIVEEIMGEMADEHEIGVKRIRSLGGGAYIVDALTDIDDLNEELNIDLPKLRYDTIGGLVMRRLGRIPREGESFEFAGIGFEVVESYPYGVRTVKLTLPPSREGGGERSD
ncbi:MAG: hemolysin family protein [Candidatus Eisenbacteria bacterium]|nr:hemolysin family protein [Candidatus Eisenbacteria bacterium]